jgi:hypothetical protein
MMEVNLLNAQLKKLEKMGVSAKAVVYDSKEATLEIYPEFMRYGPGEYRIDVCADHQRDVLAPFSELGLFDRIQKYDIGDRRHESFRERYLASLNMRALETLGEQTVEDAVNHALEIARNRDIEMKLAIGLLDDIGLKLFSMKFSAEPARHPNSGNGFLRGILEVSIDRDSNGVPSSNVGEPQRTLLKKLHSQGIISYKEIFDHPFVFVRKFDKLAEFASMERSSPE